MFLGLSLLFSLVTSEVINNNQTLFMTQNAVTGTCKERSDDHCTFRKLSVAQSYDSFVLMAKLAICYQPFKSLILLFTLDSLDCGTWPIIQSVACETMPHGHCCVHMNLRKPLFSRPDRVWERAA